METIILKCLNKESPRRYTSAQTLAHDLQAYLENRPTLPLVGRDVAERAMGWVHKQQHARGRRCCRRGGGSGVVERRGIVAWEYYQKSFNGFLQLTAGTADRPSTLALRAEVLDERGTPAAPSFTVPNEYPLALREGAYQLRLSTAGRPSETYDFYLRAHATLKTPIDLTRRTFVVCHVINYPSPSEHWRERLSMPDGPLGFHVVDTRRTGKQTASRRITRGVDRLGFAPIAEPRLVSLESSRRSGAPRRAAGCCLAAAPRSERLRHDAARVLGCGRDDLATAAGRFLAAITGRIYRDRARVAAC